MSSGSRLSLTTIVCLICLWVFFGLFLYYPIGYVFSQSFLYEKQFTHKFVQAVLFDPVLRGSLARSLLLGLTTTLLTTLVSVPLAFIYVRYQFRGKGWIGGLILLPMIMPPLWARLA